MSTPSDSFSEVFDSIRIDHMPQRPAPLTDVGLPVGPPLQAALFEDEPGFHLLDDAGGRFAIDRATGVVTLSHDHVLSVDEGGVYPARIRVVEPSGAKYELTLRLRITGRVPQIAGSQEDAALAALAAAPLLDLMHEPAPAETLASPGPTACWTSFAAVRAPKGVLAPIGVEQAPFGALFAAALPEEGIAHGDLSLPAPPAPASAHAHWLI